VGINSCGRSKHSDCLFDHGYLEEEKSIIHSFTVTFGAKYLTGMVTSVPPYETFNLIKNNILHQSKIYKNHFWGMWPLGHVGHVTYSFINILFISTGIFDDKLRPQILSVATTANSPLSPPFLFKCLYQVRTEICEDTKWGKQEMKIQEQTT